MKSYAADRSVSVPMTLSDLERRDKRGLNFLEYFRLTIAHYSRKPYLTYRMVPCLVTLTGLQTRRVDLSASAELLVNIRYQ